MIIKNQWVERARKRASGQSGNWVFGWTPAQAASHPLRQAENAKRSQAGVGIYGALVSCATKQR